MTVTAVRKDPARLTMTVDAEFDASPDRIWQLWADPRQLERWWGPPAYPATVTAHDLRTGGRVEYHMTGPSGDQPHGYWEVLEAEPPRRLVFRDGFANADGTPDSDMPLTEARVTITALGGGRTRMSIENRFPDAAAMEQLLGMGMEEGMREAVGQIDRILTGGSVSRTSVTTRTLEVPGAILTYDVRRNDASSEPALLLIGSPMGASGFQTLASHFPDRTVVTYDPRGVERSRKDDAATESTPAQHADDVHRLIQALGGGPVDLFASSGGAVNALALVERHPEDVRTLVAHEPPAASMVPDAAAALAANENIGETYQRAGFGPAMAKFIMIVGHRGPIPPGFLSGPDPDPAAFGLPTEDDGTRTDPLLFQNVVTCARYPVDVEALRAASTRIVIGVGEESEGQLARRGGEAVADRLGIQPIVFPSGHGGFLSGGYGKPDEFAAKLREVLASAAPTSPGRS